MKEARATNLQVVDANGVAGMLDLSAVPPDGAGSPFVLIRLGDGSEVFADTNTFVRLKTGSYYYPGSFADLSNQAPPPPPRAGAPRTAQSGEQLVVPVLAEELIIDRREVLTGGVRVHKIVEERTETIDEPIYEEQVEVERVAVNQIVESAPPTRYEGDVMIVPLLEEVFVVEKRLMLREEVRIKKKRAEVHRPQQVVVRREDVRLEKLNPDAEGK